MEKKKCMRKPPPKFPPQWLKFNQIYT